MNLSVLILMAFLAVGTVVLWLKRARIAAGMGARAMRAGDYQTALAYLAKATKMDPSLDMAWFQMGQCYFLTAEYQPAVEHFQRSVDTNPNQAAVVTYNLGLAYDQLGDHHAAAHAFARCIAMAGENNKAYWHYGEQLIKTGDLDGADAALSKSLALDPNFERAVQSKARLDDLRARP